MRRIGLFLLVAFAVSVLGVPLAAAPAVPLGERLAAYIARPEPAYAFTKVGEQQMGPSRASGLLMTSQVWRGITWKHTVTIVEPSKVEFPGTALLYITGGSGEPKVDFGKGEMDAQLMGAVAERIGAPAVILTHVPNQPLFGGLNEDAAISYTYRHYLEDGDPTWPLLFPMAKSAVKAMDTVQAFMKSRGKTIDSFLVCGGSKRGWTTWLTAASGDPRVKAIAPMVIDTLNMAAQMPHQLALWGKYSEMIDDYTKNGIQAGMATGRGQELLAMVDPYSYRAKLTMPKLLLHGSNDPYWATDAVTLYWDGLVGPKAVRYAPNSGHGMEKDIPRVVDTLVAFFRATFGKQPFANPVWQHGETDTKLTVELRSTPNPTGGRLWVATNPQNKDFRRCQWVSVPAEVVDGVLKGAIDKPAAGTAVALYAEAEYQLDGKVYTLSSAPRIYPPVK